MLDRESISKLCDEPGLQSTVIYRWQKEFEHGACTCEQKRPIHHISEQERIDYREKKIHTMDEVLANLTVLSVTQKDRDRGTLIGVWVPRDTRHQIADCVRRWS